jgi:hypothetical protein
MSGIAETPEEDITLPIAAAATLTRLARFLEAQLQLHMDEVIREGRAERNDPNYMPPMPLRLLQLVEQMRKTVISAAELTTPQPKSQVANFFFDVNSYSKFKHALSAQARAELARLEQQAMREEGK